MFARRVKGAYQEDDKAILFIELVKAHQLGCCQTGRMDGICRGGGAAFIDMTEEA